MFRILFFIFVLIPIIEITVLMQVGSAIGVWPTIAIIIFTAWLGANKVRQQGLATLTSVQSKMAQGQMPSEEIVTGLMLLIAGVLLVTPGFVTDIVGLALLIPRCRQLLAAAVSRHLSLMAVQSGKNSSFVDINVTELHREIKNHHAGETLEGEFERKE